MPSALTALEVLYLALVLLGRGAALERAEILPPAGLGVGLLRVEAILARRQLPDHVRHGPSAVPGVNTRSSGSRVRLRERVAGDRHSCTEVGSDRLIARRARLLRPTPLARLV